MNRQRQIELFSLEAHRLAVTRLRADPKRIQSLRDTIHRWRRQSGPSHADPYLDQWERLLADGVDAIELNICEDTDAAATLRSCSPMGSLISADERLELLAKSRTL